MRRDAVEGFDGGELAGGEHLGEDVDEGGEVGDAGWGLGAGVAPLVDAGYVDADLGGGGWVGGWGGGEG